MTVTRPLNRSQTWVLVAIVILALALRLGWVLVIIPGRSIDGGDGPYYLNAGRSLIGEGTLNWPAMLTIGPVYPFYISIFDRVLPDDESVIQAARVGQAFLDIVTCLIMFDLGRRLFETRVGLVAAALFALDLRFIRQTGDISTETIFILLLLASSWAFVWARESTQPLGPRAILAAGLGLLAAFTRAIALPIPLLLTGALLLPKPSKAQMLTVGAIVGVVALSVLGWSVRQYQLTGQWVLISDGFGGNFWMGSRSDGQWHGSIGFQKEINDLKVRYNGRLAYMEDAFTTIAANPPAYAKLLVVKGASAYLQPYGTFYFSGESLKDLVVQTLHGELTLSELVSGDSFWPKLYIYLFHFVGLIGGLIGLWLTRHQWLKLLPITLPILYIPLTYLILTIIPRYLFPIMPFYTVLAAYTLVIVFDKLAKPKPAPAVPA
jgi:4-amino-4-deoxy-L-arabinose transferase-like glycosyltransferase